MNQQIIKGTNRFEHSLCAYQFQKRISKLVATLLALASGLLLVPTSAFSQDSLVFKNNNYMTGEIKSMSKGVLNIETDYSKSDFTIEWVDIKEIYTKTRFV
jgi:surface polysaccharide O-acyltransferase-like enzyme